MATNRATTDLTKGNPLKMTVMFAIPIFLSNILQQLYNLTDIAIIGHSLGDDALTAIGTVSTIYNFFNSLMFGMASGFAVVISKYFGSKDEKGLKKRYKDLIKVFHPDNFNGDNVTLQNINREYETLLHDLEMNR